MLQRVQKIMSNAGFCSRRKAEEYIQQSKVKVNGKIIHIGDKADPDKDKITVRDNYCEKEIKSEKKRYIAFYKPKHVLTTMFDPSQKPTIMRYVENINERIFPIGRLDYDSEGLLLLTNDGDFANMVMHPRYECQKVYHVYLQEKVRPGDLEPLNSRIRLDDGYVKVDAFKLVNRNFIEIKIHEGKHKVVKRIFKKLGFYVDRLKRIQIGGIQLGSLKPGQWRELSQKEVEWAFKPKNPASSSSKQAGQQMNVRQNVVGNRRDEKRVKYSYK